MSTKRKKVLLTGATGTMGMEALKFLHAQKDQYHVILLALPAKKDRKLLAPYRNDDSVSIVWGDLTNYRDVKKAVSAADIILHIGALVSPKADSQPELAWKINFGGTKNIVDAILERDDREGVKLVYIGTVAQTGNRAAPFHWGRIGDPLVPSVFDYYALSKIAAERYVIDSGLKHWVSLRQTGIMHENILDSNDGIGFHMPLDNHLEWVTARDSGRIMLRVCEDDVPDELWGKVYNIGGGASCRLTGMQFMDRMLRALGVDFRDLNEANWFAVRNFHGHWYYDSDVLEELLHFRSENVDDVLDRLKKKLPLSLRMLKYLPKSWVKKNFMRPTATGENSPLYWLRNGLDDKVSAFLGSEEQWRKIPGWEDLDLEVDPPHRKLDHGYDERKDAVQITDEDLTGAAEFRGGRLLKEPKYKGNFQAKLSWSCAHGHSFEASPFLVLKTGHWCPECMKAPWNFDEQARSNPFIAQVWYADHDREENRVYQ